MTEPEDDESWLGRLEDFPRVLHAQASADFNVTVTDLQRAIFRALRTLAKLTKPVQVSIADRRGYFDGEASFKVGVGDKDGFDLVDRAVESRLLHRLEEIGVFPLVDTLVNIRYTVRGREPHRLQGDRYVIRWFFQPGRLALLLHHLRGVKRIPPDEIVRLVVDSVNAQLGRDGYSHLVLSSITPNARLADRYRTPTRSH